MTTWPSHPGTRERCCSPVLAPRSPGPAHLDDAGLVLSPPPGSGGQATEPERASCDSTSAGPDRVGHGPPEVTPEREQQRERGLVASIGRLVDQPVELVERLPDQFDVGFLRTLAAL